MKKNISLTAALMLSAAPIFAQDAIILDDIVVSAGIQDIAINQTGASVDVISAQDMATSGTNMANALEAVSGISMNANGGFGTKGNIRLRGLTQKYVAVRIDGIDYSDTTGTQSTFDFGGMTTSGFDRVEVLKGSQSAIYGSEAIAGVISFKTNSDAELGQSIKLGMEIGSYNTRTYDMKLSSVTENGSTSLAIVKTATDGFSAKSDNDEADAHSKTEIRLASEMDISDHFTFGLSALMATSETDYDGYAGNEHSSRDRQGLGMTLEYRGDIITHQLALSRALTERYEVTWDTAYKGARDTINYTANMTFGIADISLGSEFTNELYDVNAEDDVNAEVFEDQETALFGEVLLNFTEKTNLALAARSSDSEDFGTINLYRAAFAYHLTDNTTIRATASNGYRAPSLYERNANWSDYITGATVVAGNQDLKPEESSSFELGLSHAFKNGQIEATYFDNSITDLIDYNAGNQKYEQIEGKTKTKGLELSGRLALNDAIVVSGNYTYTESDNDGARTANVPTHDLSLAVNSKIGDATHLGASLTVAKDIVAYGNAPMEDYTVVNLSAAYDLSDDAQAYVRIENAFDEDYETVQGYNTGGRMIFAGVRASF